jgi:molybdenum cofactor guanylyltransferase
VSIVGAIIAGGQSRRFGGDKAAALLGDKTLIEHVIIGIAEQVDALVIVGREWGSFQSVADHPFPCGPLSGLCAALWFARQNGHDYVLSAGCDVLPIPPTLKSTLESDAPAVIAEQPLLGLWPASLAERLEAHIRTQSNYALRRWIEVSGARTVALPMPLHNLNTRKDLKDYSSYSV